MLVLPSLSFTLYITLYTPDTLVFTPVASVIILLVKSPSSLSYAVAPKSIYSVPLFTVTALFPTNVITGALFTPKSFCSLSSGQLVVTITALYAIASFPLESSTLYTILNAPIKFPLTLFVTAILSVIFPSTLSVAVAPGSTYFVPFTIQYGFDPFSCIIGVTPSSILPNVTSKSPNSSYLIILVFVVTFPAASCTVYVNVYLPAFVISTFPLLTTLSVKSPS